MENPTNKTTKTICGLCAHAPICKNQPQQSCPYFQLKEGKKEYNPKPHDTIPIKSKRSVVQTIKRVLIGIGILAAVIVALIGGRYSTMPRFVSQVHIVSTPVKSGLSQEDVVFEFYNAVRLHDKERLISLIHPEVLEERNWRLTSLLNSPLFEKLEEVNILNIQSEETALATTSLVINERSNAGRIQMKKYQGEWRVFEFN